MTRHEGGQHVLFSQCQTASRRNEGRGNADAADWDKGAGSNHVASDRTANLRKCVLNRDGGFSQRRSHHADTDAKQKEINHRAENERDDGRNRQVTLGIFHVASDHTDALKTGKGVKEQNGGAAKGCHGVGSCDRSDELVKIDKENADGNEKNERNNFTDRHRILNNFK